MKTKMHLWSIKQESDDSDAIFAIIKGLHTSGILKSVVGRVPSTMAELVNQAKTFKGVEDYLNGQKSNN